MIVLEIVLECASRSTGDRSEKDTNERYECSADEMVFSNFITLRVPLGLS
jgi:hypothetical protein